MSNTAISQMGDDAIRHRAARMFTSVILGELRDFIPRACEREVSDRLFKMAYDGQFELTTLDVRRELAAIKATMLEGIHHELLGHPEAKAAKTPPGA